MKLRTGRLAVPAFTWHAPLKQPFWYDSRLPQFFSLQILSSLFCSVFSLAQADPETDRWAGAPQWMNAFSYSCDACTVVLLTIHAHRHTLSSAQGQAFWYSQKRCSLPGPPAHQVLSLHCGFTGTGGKRSCYLAPACPASNKRSCDSFLKGCLRNSDF